MRAVGRVFVTLIGFIVAVIGAALFLLVAELGVDVPTGDADFLRYTIDFVFAFGYVASLIGAAALAPAALLIIVSEAFAWRSVLFHILCGGALGGAAALGLSSRLAFAAPGSGDATVLVATGFVGGCLYWLVAGRSAGLTRPDRTPPPAEPRD